MKSKKLLAVFFTKLFKKYGNNGFKLLKLANTYFVDELRKYLISKFQGVGSNFELVGENWHVNHPEYVIIGNNVKIRGAIYFEAEGGIVIGDRTYISSGVTIITAARNNQKKQVQIGEDVWIGANVCISAGVTIGDGSQIGMGTVVNRDVKPNKHINLPQNIDQKNTTDHDTSDYYPSYLQVPSRDLCFVLGTGRCGSKSIAKNLNKHEGIFAQHENVRQFIRLSTEYAHGTRQKNDIKHEIRHIFKTKTVKPLQLDCKIVHSDQRFWNMAPILRDIFPEAKFVHLIRDGRDTVRSMYARDWFADNELEIKRNNKDSEWAEYRLNGNLTGEVTKQKWRSWSAFERCCWYWSFINSSIDSELKNSKNSYLLKLEQVDEKIPDLLTFLEVNYKNISFGTYNRRKKKYKNKYQFEWGAQEEEKFQKIAGETQKKFYENT